MAEKIVVRYVQLTNHDDANWDVYINGRDWGDRYSVIVPKTSTKDEIFDLAIRLALFTQNQEGDLLQALVRKDKLREPYWMSAAFLARQEAMNYRDYMQRTDQFGNTYAETVTPEAIARARDLLYQVDPSLAAKVAKGYAFYFTTPKHRYIWYPNSRAIIWLGPDEPKYVCIHSKDHLVERNTWDWALTMRTYILGHEDHWRSTANFHPEYSIRGEAEPMEAVDDGSEDVHG